MREEGWYFVKDDGEWFPCYFDPGNGWIECADLGLCWEDSDFEDIGERIDQPIPMSKIQISNIYKNMDKLIASKNNKDKDILRMQAEDILCQMLIGLGHKELVLMYNKIF